MGRTRKNEPRYKYRCTECDYEFDEPDQTECDLEDMYGVGDLFGGHHTGIYDCCPNCGSTEIEDQ